MARRPAPSTPQPSRYEAGAAERTIGYMLVGVFALTILDLIALLGAGLFKADMTAPFWQFVLILPLPGLTIVALLVITLMVIGFVRRSRASRD